MLEIRGKVRQTLLAALLMEAGTVVSLDRRKAGGCEICVTTSVA